MLHLELAAQEIGLLVGYVDVRVGNVTSRVVVTWDVRDSGDGIGEIVIGPASAGCWHNVEFPKRDADEIVSVRNARPGGTEFRVIRNGGVKRGARIECRRMEAGTEKGDVFISIGGSGSQEELQVPFTAMFISSEKMPIGSDDKQNNKEQDNAKTDNEKPK